METAHFLPEFVARDRINSDSYLLSLRESARREKIITTQSWDRIRSLSVKKRKLQRTTQSNFKWGGVLARLLAQIRMVISD
jgi:hypothetical protein